MRERDTNRRTYYHVRRLLGADAVSGVVLDKVQHERLRRTRLIRRVIVGVLAGCVAACGLWGLALLTVDLPSGATAGGMVVFFFLIFVVANLFRSDDVKVRVALAMFAAFVVFIVETFVVVTPLALRERGVVLTVEAVRWAPVRDADSHETRYSVTFDIPRGLPQHPMVTGTEPVPNKRYVITVDPRDHIPSRFGRPSSTGLGAEIPVGVGNLLLILAVTGAVTRFGASLDGPPRRTPKR